MVIAARIVTLIPQTYMPLYFLNTLKMDKVSDCMLYAWNVPQTFPGFPLCERSTLCQNTTSILLSRACVANYSHGRKREPLIEWRMAITHNTRSIPAVTT